MCGIVGFLDKRPGTGRPLGHTLLGLLEALSCRGPGRLCRRLRLTTRHSGRHLFDPWAPLTLREGTAPPRIAVSRRVGIRKAAERPLRFFDPESPAVSAGPRLLV